MLFHSITSNSVFHKDAQDVYWALSNDFITLILKSCTSRMVYEGGG